jgi:FkbM family methyltransferase
MRFKFPLTAIDIIRQLSDDLAGKRHLHIQSEQNHLTSQQTFQPVKKAWKLNATEETNSIRARTLTYYTSTAPDTKPMTRCSNWFFRAVVLLTLPLLRPLIAELGSLSTRLNLTYSNWLCSFSELTHAINSQSKHSNDTLDALFSSVGSTHSAMSDTRSQLAQLREELREIRSLQASSGQSTQTAIKLLQQSQADTASAVARDMTEARSQLAQLREEQKQIESLQDMRLTCNLLAGLQDTNPMRVASTSEGLFIGISGDRIFEALSSGQAWDVHILNFIDQYALPRKGLALDVGANIGSLTIPLSKRFNEVLAIEADPYAYNILQATCQLNACTNVELLNAAVSSRVGKAEPAPIHMQDEYTLEANGSLSFRNSINLGAISYCPSEKSRHAVPMITLDSLNLAQVDLIKIDTQGCDGLVLLGARQLLQHSKPLIIFEWETGLAMHYGVAFEEVEQFLHSNGYTVNELHRHNAKQADYVASPV